MTRPKVRRPAWMTPAAALAALAALTALSAGTGAALAAGPHGTLPQLAPAQPAALVGTCEELPARLALPDTVITASTTVPTGALSLAGQPVPAHCRVLGRAAEHTSPVDGKTYAIGF